MGIAVDVLSGVVVTARQMEAIVRDDNCSEACRLLLLHIATVFRSLLRAAESESHGQVDVAHLTNEAQVLATCFEQLNRHSSVEEVRSMLTSVAGVIEDGHDSEVTNYEIAIELWGLLIERLFPKSPKPGDAIVIGSPEYEGYELPIGKVLYVFDEDECFERVKTQAGIALDKMIGDSTTLSTWTSFSC